MITMQGATSERVGWNKGDRVCSLVVTLATGALYLLTLTSGAYFTRDTVLYAQWVEEGWGTFHPQHLAYVPLGQLFYSLWRALGYAGRALLPLQVLSAIAGAVNAGLAYTAFRRLSSRRVALLITSFFVLCYASWRYSVEADPYPLMVMGLLLVLVLMVRRERHDLRWAVLIGAATALTSLMTLSGCLLAPAVLVVLWGSPADRDDPKKKIWLSMVYLLVVSLVVAGAYVAVAVWTEGARTPSELLRYLTRFIRGSSGWLGTGQPLSWRSLVKAVPGVGNVFVGEVPLLRWLQSTSWGWETLYAVSPAAVLVEKGAPASGLPWSVLVGIAFSIGAFAMLAVGAVWLVRQHSSIRANDAVLAWAMAAWCVAFGLGALVWLPECVHFWLPNLVPVCALIALACGTNVQKSEMGTRLTRPGWMILLVCVGMANLVGSMLPLRSPSSNPYWSLVQTLDEHVTPGAAVVSLGAGEYRQAPVYLEYYLHCKAMPVRRVFIAPDERRRQDYRDAVTEMLWTGIEDGAGAFALSDLFESELGYAQLSAWGGPGAERTEGEIESLLASWELVPVACHDGRLTLYRLEPPEPVAAEMKGR